MDLAKALFNELLVWYRSEAQDVLLILFAALFVIVFLAFLGIWGFNSFRKPKSKKQDQNIPYAETSVPLSKRVALKDDMIVSGMEPDLHHPDPENNFSARPIQGGNDHGKAIATDTSANADFGNKTSDLMMTQLNDGHDSSVVRTMPMPDPEQQEEYSPPPLVSENNSGESLASDLAYKPSFESQQQGISNDQPLTLESKKDHMLDGCDDKPTIARASTRPFEAEANVAGIDVQDDLSEHEAVSSNAHLDDKDQRSDRDIEIKKRRTEARPVYAAALSELIDKASAVVQKSEPRSQAYSIRKEYRKLPELVQVLDQSQANLVPHNVWPLLLAESVLWVQELAQILGYGGKSKQAIKALTKGDFESWIRFIDTVDESRLNTKADYPADYVRQIFLIRSLSEYLLEPDAAIKNMAQHMSSNLNFVSGWCLLANMCYQQGEFGYAIACFSRLFKAGGLLDSEVLSLSRGNYGYCLFQNHDFIQAQQHYREALQVLTEVKDNLDLCHLLNNIGMCELARKNLVEAEVMIKRSMMINEELGRKRDVAAQMVNLGIICYHRNDLQSALSLHKQSLKIEEELGDKEGLASDHSNIGKILKEMGQYSEALSHQKAALKAYKELDDATGYADSVSVIGMIYSDQGEFEMAERQLMQALELREKESNLYGMANELTNLAKNAFSMGNSDRARSLFKQSVELFSQKHNRYGAAEQYRKFAEFEKKVGDLKQAESYYRIALQSTYLGGDTNQIVEDLLNLAAIGSLRRNYDIAREHLSRALKHARREKQPQIEARIQIEIGKVALRQGNVNTSKEAFHAAMRIYSDEKDEKAMLFVQGHLVLACYLKGSEPELAAALSKVDKMSRQVGDAGMQADIHRRLGCFMMERKDLNEARKFLHYSLTINTRLLRTRQKALDMSSLGLLYRYLKDYDQSIKFLKDSYQINEKESVYEAMVNDLGNLGLTSYEAGLYEQAMGYYERCAKLLGFLGRHAEKEKVIKLIQHKQEQSRNADQPTHASKTSFEG